MSTNKSNKPTKQQQKMELPKGFENHQSVQVYIKATPSNDSKHNKLRQEPPKDGKTKPCYWLGEYHAMSPSEIWIFPKGTKEPSELRGNVHGTYGYNNGMHDTLWFLPPKASMPKSFTPQGMWTFPVQKRDFSSIEPEEAGFLDIGHKANKIEKLDVSGQWRLLYKRDGEQEPMTVFVKTPEGELIDLLVEPDDTIDQIKDMVQDILPLTKRNKNKPNYRKPPKNEIRLHFKNEPLNDPSKTVEDCGIQHRDVLDMEPTIVYVKDLKNKTHTLTVDLDDPIIKSVKKPMEHKVGIPTKQQRLFFNPNKDALEDAPNLRDYGIKHKDTLQLQPMQIHVKTPQGKTVTLNVQPDDSILDVKCQVEKKENIPAEDQRLTFKGKELKDPKSTLYDNNLQHGDTLNLEPMTIYVRTPDGKKTITLSNVQPTDTIQDIKQRVQDKEGIPVDDQRLLFRSKELDNNNCNLKDYGIVHKDTLDLEGMHIFVKENWTGGKKHKLYVEASDTVDSVKDQLKEKEGHEKKNQFLIFKGVLLDDQPTLRDYDIKHKDVLNLERMKIYVKDWKGKTFTLDVSPTETIDSVKEKIQDREGHPKMDQQLFFKQDLLDVGTNTLEDHNVKHKDMLELKKKEREIPPVSPKPQKAALTPKNSPKGPEYNVGLSPWSDPLSPAGYSPKRKLGREGVRAKGKAVLKDRYHTDLASEIQELGLMAQERHSLKKKEQEYLKKREEYEIGN